MPDSSAIDAALIAKLLGDATLMALVPDGVYSDIAAPGATRFLIVKLIDEEDVPMFGGRAFEETIYQVTAVMNSTSGTNANAAAARIDVLLEGGTLSPVGYTLMYMQRVGRIRTNEADVVNPDARWQWRGGLYEITASL